MAPDPYSGKTARERYSQHSAAPVCANCHQYIDPLGFPFENYDAVGLYRATERWTDPTTRHGLRHPDRRERLGARGDRDGQERRRAGQAARHLAGGRELLRVALDALRVRAVARPTPTAATSRRSSTLSRTAATTSSSSCWPSRRATASSTARRNRRDSAMTRLKLESSNGHPGRRHHRRRAALAGGDGAGAAGARADGLRSAQAVRDRVSAGRRRSHRRQRRQVHADRQRDVVHDVADPDAAATGAEPAASSSTASISPAATNPSTPSSSTRAERSGGSPARFSRGRATIRPKSPSMDQVLATRLSTGKAYGSLQFAVRWATGKSHGKISPMNAMYFVAAAAPRPAAARSAGHLQDAVRHGHRGDAAGRAPTRTPSR